MPINSRAKGARVERWFSKLLNELFPGANARRGQQYNGIEGDDIVSDIEGVHFESKGMERLNVYGAMEQARGDAKESVPVVLWKRNHEPPLAVCFLEDLPTLSYLLTRHLTLNESTSNPHSMGNA